MKTVKVAAAVIEKDGKILIGKWAYGSRQGLWEFPGGKIEEGESGRQAIVREIAEELGVQIGVKAYLCNVRHRYEDFDLDMDCFICVLYGDRMVLHDHVSLMWIDPDEEGIGWVPADRKVIEAYREYRKKARNGPGLCYNDDKGGYLQ